MMGAALSRWTMAYFTAALLFLLAVEALIVAGYGFPTDHIRSPQTLIVVHMVTIGWLSLLMCGALFQFVPVLVARPLLHPSLVLPALICLLAGLGCLLAGFLQQSGSLDIEVPFLGIAGALLPAGFALVVVVLGHTLWSGRPLSLPARFVAWGLVFVVTTAVFGALFTAILSGFASVDLAGTWWNEALPLHITAGLGGWLTFSAIGVSYRLLPMFMLSPDDERRSNRVVLWCGVIALMLVIIGYPVEKAIGGLGAALPLAFVTGLAAVASHCFDLVFFYTHRKRRKIELNSLAAVAAFSALYLSVVLFAVLLASGTLATHIGALLYLVAFGWLTGLGLSQLYKIVPFLTWLECYGPVMGRKPTPRVQDLVMEGRDRFWFALYFCAVAVGTGALLVSEPVLFRLAVAGTFSATVALVVEMVLVRRLFNIAVAARLPEGTVRPNLFLVSPR